MQTSDLIGILKSAGVTIRKVVANKSRIETIEDLKRINEYIITDHPRLTFIITANQLTLKQLVNCASQCYAKKVGENTSIIPPVYIENNVVIENNSVIGATGQGFERDFNGKLWLMPQVGTVYIGDDCFIGSNVTICRGTLEPTIIQKGVRIAHGTHIGHNVCIGLNTFIANGVSIAGSVQIGKDCFVGAGAVIRNKVKIADNVTIGCGAVVVKNIDKEGSTVVGNPAKII